MSKIRGYKNNQPVGTFNKMDVPNGIYYADPTRPDSDVYGDLRESREGRGLLGDGSMYVTITGLLTTDTITAINGSDTPTCTIDGRLDIANLDEVFEFYVYRSSVLIGHYTVEEETGTQLMQVDTSLLLPNGLIVNSSPSNFITDNSVGISYANTYGHTISDGATYYYDNGGVNLIPINVIIPRDESNPSKCCAYLSGGTQADLQYKGKVPYQFHVTNSPCFKGVTGSYMTLDVEPADIITAHGNSAVPTCTTSGQLDFVNDSLYYGITITRAGTKIAFIPMTNDPAIGTYYDAGVVGGTPTNNDATLVNGSPANQGYQKSFCWLQQGRYDNGSDYVPLLEDFSAFADGTALGSGVVNSGSDFLNTGETLTLDATPETVQADAANNVYFDSLGDPIEQTFKAVAGVAGWKGQYYSGNKTPDKVSNISIHKAELNTVQSNTEFIVRNCDKVGGTRPARITFTKNSRYPPSSYLTKSGVDVRWINYDNGIDAYGIVNSTIWDPGNGNCAIESLDGFDNVSKMRLYALQAYDTDISEFNPQVTCELDLVVGSLSTFFPEDNNIWKVNFDRFAVPNHDFGNLKNCTYFRVVGDTTMTSIIAPISSVGVYATYIQVTNNHNLTSLDLSTMTMSGGALGITGNSITSIITPNALDGLQTLNLSNNSLLTTLSTTATYNSLVVNLYGCSSLGYNDLFTRIMVINSASNYGCYLYDMDLTTEEVNHYLVDMDNNSVGASITPGTTKIDVSGTNAAPDSSSGGYDGLTAVSNLIAKGYTVITS